MIFKDNEIAFFSYRQEVSDGEFIYRSRLHKPSGTFFSMVLDENKEFRYFSVGLISKESELEETESFSGDTQKSFFDAVRYFEKLVAERTPPPKKDPPFVGYFMFSKTGKCYITGITDKDIILTKEEVEKVFSPPKKKPFGRLNMTALDDPKFDVVSGKFALNFDEEKSDEVSTKKDEYFAYRMTPYQTSDDDCSGGNCDNPAPPPDVSDDDLKPSDIEDEDNLKGDNDKNDDSDDGNDDSQDSKDSTDSDDKKGDSDSGGDGDDSDGDSGDDSSDGDSDSTDDSKDSKGQDDSKGDSDSDSKDSKDKGDGKGKDSDDGDGDDRGDSDGDGDGKDSDDMGDDDDKNSKSDSKKDSKKSKDSNKDSKSNGKQDKDSKKEDRTGQQNFDGKGDDSPQDSDADRTSDDSFNRGPRGGDDGTDQAGTGNTDKDYEAITKPAKTVKEKLAEEFGVNNLVKRFKTPERMLKILDATFTDKEVKSTFYKAMGVDNSVSVPQFKKDLKKYAKKIFNS